MNTEQINEYSEKLCEDIKFKYLQDFCKKEGNWFNLCQKSMHDFVLSRSGWLRSNKSDDVFLFNNKYPITVNVLYDGSPGSLLVNTAVNIAIAELINEFDDYLRDTIDLFRFDDKRINPNEILLNFYPMIYEEKLIEYLEEKEDS